MSKKLALILVLFYKVFGLSAQIDSLKQLLAENPQNDTLQAIILNDLAWEYAYTDAQKAQEYAQKSLDISLKAKFLRGQATSYGMLGIIKDIRGESQEALNFYLKELYLEEKLGNLNALAATLTNIGVLHFNQEQYEQALKYFQRSLAIERQMQNDFGVLGSLINIGVIYKNLQTYEKAQNFLQEAQTLNKKIKDEQQEGYILANMASIELVYGKNLEKAHSLFWEAAKINQKTNNQSALSIAYNGLSETSCYQEKYLLSIEYARKALEIALELKAKKQIQASYLNLAQSYEKLGNYARAYEFFQQYATIKEKLINETNYKQITEAEAKFESEKQKRIIAEKEISLQKSQRNLWFSFALLGLLIVLASLFYGLFYAKKKANRDLILQKQKTEKALKDREVLLQEIHHRVKNNLQIISSLLNLQSRQAKDKDTTEAIRQATNRVKSMALLHQNLYQNDNLQLIKARDYIGQLVQSLMSAYKKSDSVSIEKNIEDLDLDIDLMMPLGLVLNEWLTNALKYAFPDERQGEIRIDLLKKEDVLILEVSDNGIGFEDKGEKSFGRSLVEMLAEKIEADISYKNQNGVVCTLKKYLDKS